LLRLLVLVQWLQVAECPLAFTLLGTRTCRASGGLGHGCEILRNWRRATLALVPRPWGTELACNRAPGTDVVFPGRPPRRTDVGRRVVSRANTSCCGYARSPRGVEPRGGRGLQH